MSQSVQTVRRAVEVFQGEVTRSRWRVLSPLRVSGTRPGRRPEREHSSARRVLPSSSGYGLRIFADWTFRLTDVRDTGDHVLAFARQVAVGKGSGVSVEMELAMLSAPPDGLIDDVRVFIDRDEALEAAGLAG